MKKQERRVDTLNGLLTWRSLVDRNMLLHGALRIAPLYAEHWKLYNDPKKGGFRGVNDDLDERSKVDIVFKYTQGTINLFKEYGLDINTKKKKYKASLRMKTFKSNKYPNGKKEPWLNYNYVKELKERLILSFSMTNAMNIESDLNTKKLGNNLNLNIQEFLDVEYDFKSKTFYFTPYFIQFPNFPHLFNLLAHRSKTTNKKNLFSSSNIDFNDWKPVVDFNKHSALATSVIYMFLSKKRKEIYIGITTKALGGSAGRYSATRKNGGPNKKDMSEWDYFKFDKLPEELAGKNLKVVEDILIRTFSSIMKSSNDIITKQISNYTLTNKAIR